MAKYTVEITLPDEENKLFREYIKAKSLDADKWLVRIMLTFIYSTLSRYRQPKGRPNQSLFEGVAIKKKKLKRA